MSLTPRLVRPLSLLTASDGETAALGSAVGVLPQQRIRGMIRRRMIRGIDEILTDQIQPASLDLRLGKYVHRVRASFLPGKGRTVEEQLGELSLHEIPIGEGAILERGCVYVVELLESLALPPSVSAVANPKSSTGRLDVFTRLITDRSEIFDTVESGYGGRLYAEISPRTFSVKVYTGSRLNQVRFRRRSSSQTSYTDFRLGDRDLEKIHRETPLVDGAASIRNGLQLRVNLRQLNGSKLIGYRAQKFTDIVDIDKIGRYRVRDFWEPIFARKDGRLILDPDQFYILASTEKVHIPDSLAAEMVPIDPTMGEFRVHYAGFFDPGFGSKSEDGQGSRAVLEVRSHEVPFILEHGQIVGRLVYERLAERPDQAYGRGIGSHYQAQGLKLSKHFKQD